MNILVSVRERKANGRLYPVQNQPEYALDILEDLLGVTGELQPDHDEEPDTYYVRLSEDAVLRHTDEYGTFHVEGPVGAASAFVERKS